MKRITPFLFPLILIIATYFILIKDYEKSASRMLTTQVNGETIQLTKWDKYTNARSGFYKGECYILPINHPIQLSNVTKTVIKEMTEINMKDVLPKDVEKCIYKARMFKSDASNKPYKL
jgi:hypothetical protein